jgi:hypothetical protein
VIWVNVNYLSATVGLLEKSPEVSFYDNSTGSFMNVSLNSTICEWEGNYTFTKNYTHSLTTYFNFDCDSFKIGLMGSFVFAGNFLGCFLFQFFCGKIWKEENTYNQFHTFAAIDYRFDIFI